MRVTVIADASHCCETGAAGYGWWTASERGKRGGGGQVRQSVDSSSAAEMIAIVNAIHASGDLIQQGDHLLLQTDCQAAIDAFDGKRNRLTKDEQAAKKAFFDSKKELDFRHSFRHVKGHTSRPEARYVTNNLCDKRAKSGMRLARKRLADSKGADDEA